MSVVRLVTKNRWSLRKPEGFPVGNMSLRPGNCLLWGLDAQGRFGGLIISDSLLAQAEEGYLPAFAQLCETVCLGEEWGGTFYALIPAQPPLLGEPLPLLLLLQRSGCRPGLGSRLLLTAAGTCPVVTEKGKMEIPEVADQHLLLLQPDAQIELIGEEGDFPRGVVERWATSTRLGWSGHFLEEGRKRRTELIYRIE